MKMLVRSLVLATPLVLLACSEKPASAPAQKQAAPAQKQEAPAQKQAAPAPTPAPSAEITDAARTEAQEIFKMRCVMCHGEKGLGDGAAAASLTPKPASFASAEWQASVTDEHIEKIITLGGGAVGKSILMPGNPDLVEKPAVVAALREYIRSFKP